VNWLLEEQRREIFTRQNGLRGAKNAALMVAKFNEKATPKRPKPWVLLFPYCCFLSYG
jgi:hypothetical protein